ncbi:hypothetical protein SeLEV6574_g03282 [Synchytrium endobioticum]|nr:hypothetical protein SeLEV6574_g03282 [Synchytrium endobioticum]
MAKKLFVTGGATRTGAQICEAALSPSFKQYFDEVRTTYHKGEASPSLTNAGVKVCSNVDIHFATVQDWKNMMQGCDTVVLVPELSRHKLQIAISCLKAVGQCDQIGDLIVVSMHGCTDPQYPSMLEFLQIEEVAKRVMRDDGHLTILRSAHYYQNLCLYAPQIRNTSTLSLSIEPTTRLAMIDLRDTALAVAKIACMNGQDHIVPEFRNKTFTITGPQALSCDEICELMSRVLAKKVEYKKMEYVDHSSFLSDAKGLNEGQVEIILEELQLAGSGVLGYVTNAIKRILDRDGISFEDWLKEAQDVFQKPGEGVTTAAGKNAEGQMPEGVPREE